MVNVYVIMHYDVTSSGIMSGGEWDIMGYLMDQNEAARIVRKKNSQNQFMDWKYEEIVAWEDNTTN